MRTFVVFSLVALHGAVSAAAQPQLVDDFESLAAWTVAPSDGVRATISPAEGFRGRCLRLDFDFERGAGFCVIRRAFERDLPKNYRFAFDLRGEGLRNNFEFKLIDAAGDSVWWVNQRAFDFPKRWETIRYKARHFSFAWGPSGGAPLTRLSAIEFAIASASGGKGSLFIDELTFEALPDVRPTTEPPSVAASTHAPERPLPKQLPESGELNWTCAPNDPAPMLTLDCQVVREFGGLTLEWAPDEHAAEYEVLVSPDLERWESAAKIVGGGGGRDDVPIAGGEARGIRVQLPAVTAEHPVTLRTIRLLPPACGESPNEMFAFIARESPRGLYPRYFRNEQPYWTVVGVPGCEREALLDSDGALEIEKLGFRLEPFLRCDGKLITWADVRSEVALAEGYLPIPTVTWRAGDLVLEVTVYAIGPAGHSQVFARYALHNTGGAAREVTLCLALRPFQVLPPWQALNLTGGVGQINRVRTDGQQQICVDSTRPYRLRVSRPVEVLATSIRSGEIAEWVAMDQVPPACSMDGPERLDSAVAEITLQLPPGGRESVVVAAQLGTDAEPEGSEGIITPAEFDRRLSLAVEEWRAQLNRTSLRLPPEAAPLVDTYRATQAYILINADGPAIQPGSRTYERSWIRDGALTSTALLHTGHPEQVKAFLDWYGPYQFDNGKVPCVVDHRGPDPVPEHDSTGQYIYLLHKYYRMTGDRDMLERHLPRVVAAVEYLESLRNQRLTPEYRDGPPEKRACYGLVPESISHEGYSAKPMHSYWDSFFVLRGLKDAASIAAILGRSDLEQRFARLRDEYRQAVHDSLKLAMELKQIDFIPGCVELGDFDATSTAIALFPCDEADYLPQGAVQRTFDKYWQFVCDRRDGQLVWENYTPYELRVLGAFIRLGQPERAHAALEFFMQDQRPRAWHHWAEVVWRDPHAPKFIGDMPHTWCGTEFLNSLRSMFVYERERDGSLVIGGGVKPEWLRAPGVAIENWPTEYGPLSYELWRTGDKLHLRLNNPLRDWPPGGLVVVAPWNATFTAENAREVLVTEARTEFEWNLVARR